MASSSLTSLFQACRDGNIEQIKRLAKKANVNQRELGGFTPLHLVASKGYAVAIPILVKVGADLEARESGSSMTPLLLAAYTTAGVEISESGLSSALHALINHGANLAALDRFGNSALTLSLKYNCWSPLIPCTLLELGAVPSQDDVAIAQEKLENPAAIERGFGDVFFLLCEKAGITPSAEMLASLPKPNVLGLFDKMSSSSLSPLFQACRDKNEEQIKHLAKKANVNQRGLGGFTPLHLVASKGFSRPIPILVKVGADLEVKESVRSMTPLLLAAFTTASDWLSASCLSNAIRVLIDQGANLAALDRFGDSALTLSLKYNYLYPLIPRTLLELGAVPSQKDVVVAQEKLAIPAAVMNEFDDVFFLLCEKAGITPSAEMIAPLPKPIVLEPFGKKDWATYFGDIGIEPPLPPDIEQLLDAPCPMYPRKKVKETHFLVLIPQTLNGQPLTIQRLREIVQRPIRGYATQLNPGFYGSHRIDFDECNIPPPTASHWVLVSRYITPESQVLPVCHYRWRHPVYNTIFARNYEAHKKLVKQQYPGYQVPPVLDLTVAILMHHVRSGMYFYNSIMNEEDFTFCKETYYEEHKFIVGAKARSNEVIIGQDWRRSNGSPAGIGIVRTLEAIEAVAKPHRKKAFWKSQ